MSKDIFEHLIDVNKVAKATLDSGMFMLVPVSEEFNLLVTTNFILQLNDEQFWKVQCKLEAKTRNVWLYKDTETEGPETMNTPEKAKTMYFNAVNNPNANILVNTNLIFDNSTQIYCNAEKYFGIQRKYLEMTKFPTVKLADKQNLFVVDDVHIIAPIKLPDECEYLREISL